ncbi:MAG: 5-formyltetrahydrofolate cyclo-ligase [Breznakibacter sp.]
MEGTIDQKNALRAMVKERLAEVPPVQLAAQSQSIFQKVEQLPAFHQASHILAYWSMLKEVDTHFFVEKWTAEKHVYLPVVQGEDLQLVRFSGRGQMARHPRFFIYEPLGDVFVELSKISLAIVPGLAFDRHGRRLGKGGGFYDRFLPKLTNAQKIGVAFAEQMVDEIPVEPHDRSVDLVISAR